MKKSIHPNETYLYKLYWAGSMKRILHFFMPKEKKFLGMIAEQSEITLEAAKELKAFVKQYSEFERSERKPRAQSIKRLEQKINGLTHVVLDNLNKSFATSVDKEDIYKIAVLLEEISDLVSGTALRFVILSIERIDTHITKLVDIAHSAIEELNSAIISLKKLKYSKEHCIKIYGIENEADEVSQEALSELFHFYKNSIDIIKYKEIYELLENIINKCRNTAEIIERIIARHT